HLRCTAATRWRREVGPVALPVKALKAGQEAYWLDQIARNREEYFSGRGESQASSSTARSDPGTIKPIVGLGMLRKG
ncbi:MAG TPA: hypothetical protein VLA80_15050, partial [Actinomycetota bacterium]|nr:hypothetical protein [Actinomycetota bacterium]